MLSPVFQLKLKLVWALQVKTRCGWWWDSCKNKRGRHLGAEINNNGYHNWSVCYHIVKIFHNFALFYRHCCVSVLAFSYRISPDSVTLWMNEIPKFFKFLFYIISNLICFPTSNTLILTFDVSFVNFGIKYNLKCVFFPPRTPKINHTFYTF